MRDKVPSDSRKGISNKKLIVLSCALLISIVGNIVSGTVKTRAEQNFRYWQSESKKDSEKYRRYRDKIEELEQEIDKLQDKES